MDPPHFFHRPNESRIATICGFVENERGNPQGQYAPGSFPTRPADSTTTTLAIKDSNMNSSEYGPHLIAPAPIFILRLIREPIASQPVMAPLGVAQILCNSFWTRSVELEDSLGRKAPGAGTFKRGSTLP